MKKEESEESVYLLDTNHCSFIIIQKDTNVINKLESLPKDTIIAINSIIYGELILMAEKSDNKKENTDLIESFAKNLVIHPIDQDTSKIYGKFHAEIFDKFAPKDKKDRRKFKIKDIGIYPNDLWIACTAIQYNLTIVSEDSDFKQMSTVRSLNLECWKSKAGSIV
ncbi:MULTISPECIES: type II toxin-antitoxin system VapC family toxin [unclassified Nostoc]|uniref:type II toxin-antitoxin system VapC family toxin n=1 Tax=unclassified Nostoc TaxID=2593658 RepID=UPI00260E7756|nr:type II toxin-antitoxin system VapC family toxin [Nostoc sp. S13]MDF5739584.1 type II toxin-antitoxin system VapC family toxin [Nostoc sp. S13]